MDERILKLQEITYDPESIIYDTFKELDEVSSSEIDIVDPTNPFTFLLTNNAEITSASLYKIESSLKRMFPQLATNKEELYNFITSTETIDIFSVPSKGTFILSINYNQFLSTAISKDGYKELLLPKYTKIKLNDTIFLTTSDIYIRVYDNRNIMVYEIPDLNNKLCDKVSNFIESNLITSDNISWITITLELLQVDLYNIQQPIIEGNTFTTTYKIDDYYTYCKATSINPITNEEVILNVSYNSNIYNPSVPTIILKPDNNEIKAIIPALYTLNNMISSNVNILLFTTKGDINLPLKDYNPSDYIIDMSYVNEETLNPSFIDMKVTGIGFTLGGKNEITFNELKDTILLYSSGDNKIPITKEEIEKEIDKLNLKLLGMNDIIDSRELFVTDTITDNKYSNLTKYSATVNLNLKETNSDKIIYTSDKVTIEPGQLFKFENNKLSPLTNAEEANLDNLSLDEYNNTKIFYTPFKYCANVYNSIMNITAYDTATRINYETVTTTFINNKNNVVIMPDDRKIIYNNGVYTVTYIFNPDNPINMLDESKIGSELRLKSTVNIVFKGNIDKTTDGITITFNIETDKHIVNDKILVLNADINNNNFIDISTYVDIKIYTTDPNIVNINNTIEIYLEPNATLLYVEDLKLDFAYKLENLFTDYDIIYTGRMFKVYEEDVYKTYSENVYETDKNGLPIMKPIDTNGDGIDDDVELVLLHREGEVILDETGEPIILHHKGDIMLDENGNPIIDNIDNAYHSITMVLIEDAWNRITNMDMLEYRDNEIAKMKEIILETLPNFKERLLEKTNIYYKPIRKIAPVTLYANNKPFMSIEPNNTLYILLNTDKVFNITVDKTWLIYNKFLSIIENDTNLSTIKSTINDILDIEINEIELKLIDGYLPNVITYGEPDNRISIGARLGYNSNNEKIIMPNVLVMLNNI